MRPQNRPFTVEIKKTKRAGAPVAGTPAAVAAPTWAEQFEQATALSESAARRAAEALFSAPRPAASQPSAPASQPWPEQGERLQQSVAPVRTGRILMALHDDVVAEEPEADLSADADPVGRPARIRKVAVKPTRPVAPRQPEKAEAVQPAARPAAPRPQAPVPAVIAAAPLAVAAEDASAAAPAARKGSWRRGAPTTFARGEKWKRRLPQALR